jgi:hypothetical protein
LLDGCALGGVAGERVAVLEVVGRIGEWHGASGTCVGVKRDRALVEVGDGSEGAVAKAEARVVAAAEDAIADAEVVAAELDGVGAELACQQVVLGDLPPVLEQALLRASFLRSPRWADRGV